MIRGYFSRTGTRRRPFLDAVLHFPAFNQSLEVSLLVDTGADRTILAPLDALRLVQRFGLDLLTLPSGAPSTGVGGQTGTRTIAALLTLDGFTTPLTLTLLEPPPGPSLLGRWLNPGW